MELFHALWQFWNLVAIKTNVAAETIRIADPWALWHNRIS